MVSAARKLGTEAQYMKFLAENYGDGVTPNLPQIFEFFAAHPKKP
jgi:hypothetical protein